MARLPSAYSQRPHRRPSSPTQPRVAPITEPLPEVELIVASEPEVVAPEVSRAGFQGMTKAALIKNATDLGLQFPSSSRKDDLIKLLCEHFNLD